MMNDKTKQDTAISENELDYEKDSRFISYMKSRLEMAVKDREAGQLVDSDIVFADIRARHEWR